MYNPASGKVMLVASTIQYSVVRVSVQSLIIILLFNDIELVTLTIEMKQTNKIIFSNLFFISNAKIVKGERRKKYLFDFFFRVAYYLIHRNNKETNTNAKRDMEISNRSRSRKYSTICYFFMEINLNSSKNPQLYICHRPTCYTAGAHASYIALLPTNLTNRHITCLCYGSPPITNHE